MVREHSKQRVFFSPFLFVRLVCGLVGQVPAELQVVGACGFSCFLLFPFLSFFLFVCLVVCLVDHSTSFLFHMR